MKFGPLTRLDKRNKTTSKNFDHNARPKNCDVIAICPIYDQFGAIWKPENADLLQKMLTSAKLVLSKFLVAMP